MVHNRYNERETNPNLHINFITPLPFPGAESPYSEEDARQLLRALAAQVRPIMKNHGFAVNSFEEYEYNHVFAGRNWNAGETVELVLRRVDGTFVAIPWLMSTLCHELAHIKHMNHGREFQKLWAQLRSEVTALQAKGYFGDGFWSSGSRLADSTRIGGHGVQEYDLPEYVCGGAQTRSRPKALGKRRRRVRQSAGPSNRTGAQTEKKRKAGTRVTAKGKFGGDGKTLATSIDDTTSTFRKQAGSKRAREERAMAAEKRLRALQGESSKPKRDELEVHELSSDTEGDDDDDDDDDDDVILISDSDDNRRRMLQETMNADELETMRQFKRDFMAESSSSKPPSKGKGKERESPSPDSRTERSSEPSLFAKALMKESMKAQTPFAMKSLVKDEMVQRRRESLGLGEARKLGGRPNGAGPLHERAPSESPGSLHSPANSARGVCGIIADSSEGENWTCFVCTLENVSAHLACMACNTPKGETAWKEN